MKRIIKIAAPVIGIVILSSSFTAFAYDLDGDNNFLPSQIHTQITELIKNGDFDAAKALRDEFRSQFQNPEFGGHDGFGHKGGMKGEMGEMREEMDKIFENNDYEAWLKLMDDRPGFEGNLNQETFQSMSEIHDLMESGDEETADELRKQFIEDLGLENVVKLGKGSRGGRGFHMNR